MNLLRTNAAFRRLWLARFVSFLGDSLGLVALIVYLSRRTDSGAVVGLLLLAGDLTPALLAPAVGVVADRTEARRTMVTCELVQAAAVGAIVLLQPATPLILLLVAVRAVVAGVFQATSRSLVPELVADEELERANTVLGFGTHGLEALGALLAAGLLLAVTARAVLAVDVVTFLLSPLLLVGLPRVEVAVDVGAGVLRDVRDGLDAVWRLPLVRTLALTFWTFAVFTAADDVALPFLGRHDFGTGDAGVSLLYAGGGIGVVLGLLLVQRRAAAPFAVAMAGLAVGGAGNALTGIAPAVAVAVAMQTVRGIGNAWVGIGTDTLVQREAPRAVRGRVFAIVYGGVGIAAGVSYLAGGPIVDAAGPRAVLGVGGACGVACAAIAAWASRSRATRTPGSPTVPSP
jgi:MFS family permease